MKKGNTPNRRAIKAYQELQITKVRVIPGIPPTQGVTRKRALRILANLHKPVFPITKKVR